MSEFLRDLKALAGEFGGLGRELVIEWVGEQIRPTLKELTAGWTEQGVIDAIRTGQHIYPLYPEDIKAGWREAAKPYRDYAAEIPKDFLFRWFRAASPELARVILAQPGGWSWLVDEFAIVLEDLCGEPERG
ncbi:MAG: hypothetical protein C0405_14190 [Desulfovibrio sp.]|nr:hypothetical protein [Desulfovibrio sp.]